jgi:hypothetical protein
VSTTTGAQDGSVPLPATFEVVGTSAEGRSLVVAEFGDGPLRVFVIGGIHGDERTGVDTSRQLLDHLRLTLPAEVTIRWMIDANPDGSAARDRDNGNEVDINRNWPTGHSPSPAHGETPLSEPETRALLAQIEAFDPDVIVAMHSAREGPFVNYDGPGAGLAAAFALGATGERVWEVVPTVDWPTPGSLGTHFGTALGTPVITVEGNRWDHPDAVLVEFERGFATLLGTLITGDAPDAPVCHDHSAGRACSDLTRRVEEAMAIDVLGGTSGFLLKKADGLVHAARWADSPIYPASSVKVVHLTHLLIHAADLARTIPNDTSCTGMGGATGARIGDLVDAMLIASDNGATNALQHWIGIDGLNATAEALGMVGTRIEHGFGCGGPANDPANRSTIADLVALYDAVATGKILSGPTRDIFLDSLPDITDSVTAELGIDAPEGTRIVAKAGWYGWELSIAGIAETAHGTFVFGTYTSAPRDLSGEFVIERVVAELLRDHLVLTDE